MWFFWPLIVAAVVPRPALVYVLGRSLAGGTRAGHLATVGVLLSSGVHVIFSLLWVPLPLLCLSHPVAFQNLMLAGAAYLSWAGLRMLLAPQEADTEQEQALDDRRTVLQALLLNLLDPLPVADFFFRVLYWSKPDGFSIVFALQALIECALVLALIVVGLSYVSVAGTRLRLALRLMLKRHTVYTIDFGHVMGALLIGLGLWLALQRG